MEQLSAFFTNVQRIADAAERSAAALETIAMLQGGDDMPEIGTTSGQTAPGGTQSAPAPEGGAKRKRRTKAEMAADSAQAAANAGQAASVIGAVLGAPASAPAAPPAMPGFPAFGAASVATPGAPMAAPGFPAAPVGAPGLPTAPVGAAPAPMAGAMDPSAAFVAAGQQPSTAAIAPQVTAPPVAQPPAAQPAALPDVSQLAAQYAALPVEQQFGALLDLFAKYGNYISVRDAMTQATGEVHCPMPLSDPLDRSKPGAAYTALANEARWHIYASLYRAASSIASAG